MQVHQRPVADLYSDPSNARLHSRLNLDAIKASLLKFGQQHPLVVTEDGMVVAGNGRLAGMLELGWTECDTVTTTLSGVELAGFSIADNRTAELAEWDEDALARTLIALRDEDGIEVADAGFDSDALAEALKAGLEPEPEPEPEPTIPEEHAPADEDREPHASEVEVLQGDCRERMAAMDAESFTAVVCDPPYELAFMGKAWDASGIAFDVKVWEEALRVLKPGGYLLAFGGTRTYHRLAVAIEDAGFEVRDCFAWMYGSGFPKSHDVGKAIDKRRDDSERVRVVCRWLRGRMEAAGETAASVAGSFGFNARMVDHWAARDSDSQPTLPKLEQWDQLRELLSFSEEMDAEVYALNMRKGERGDAWAEREVVGKHAEGSAPGGFGHHRFTFDSQDITAPATDLAKLWHGYGTALKPAYEPCIIARKPLVGTVAQNVEAHGCGALNVDGARIGTEEGGRWPANVLLDEDAACILDGQSGDDDQGASRFFYTAKASTSERSHDGKVANTHATVKPIAVMRYLLNLVKQPKTNRILDPFAGSGTTLIAAIREGLDVVGIELDEKHIGIIEARVSHEPNAITTPQPTEA